MGPWLVPARLREVPLSLSPSCVTAKKKKNGRGRSIFWGRDDRERISRGQIFLAVFFRVTHDRLNETAITRSVL